MESFKEGKPLVLFSLLPHEQKVNKRDDTLEGCAAPCSFRLHGLDRVWLQRVWAEISPHCSCFKAGQSTQKLPGGFRIKCLSLALVTSDLLGPHFQGHSSLLKCPGAFCCPPSPASPASSPSLCCLFQMSVLNFLVRRHPGNSEPVRAKEELIFHCGFRRFRASPLFSQHTSGLSGTGYTRSGVGDSRAGSL